VSGREGEREGVCVTIHRTLHVPYPSATRGGVKPNSVPAKKFKCIYTYIYINHSSYAGVKPNSVPANFFKNK
jgi:hypothetical protein